MIVDLFLVYHFIKRLATPFKEWDAFEQGIIDEKGNILKKSKDLKTVKERDAWGKFDLMILKLKRLLEKVPGGSSRIASYAAALYLIKEHNSIDAESITEEEMIESFNNYVSLAEENTVDINAMFEEEIANSAGGGEVAGIGVGKDGEPGVSKSKSHDYKNKKKRKSFRDTLGKLS
jgi:hypothetical protein